MLFKINIRTLFYNDDCGTSDGRTCQHGLEVMTDGG